MTEEITTQKSNIMRATVIIFIAAFLGFTLGGPKVSGQVVAIGHVSAEIVESVSAASATITNFELAKSTNDISTSLTSETLNLGSITLNSGKDVSCNVVLKPATLSNSEGNGFTIEPAVTTDLLAAAAKANGSQTIQLGGTTNRTSDQASGLYKGSYTVVFAYN
jgi:hypothetical protein